MSQASSEAVIMARRSARGIIAVVLFSAVFASFGWHFVKRESEWMWPTAAGIAALTAVLVEVLHRLPAWGYAALSLATIGAAMATSGHATYLMAMNGYRFEAFAGFKLAAFVAALLAPSPAWAGYAIIAAAAVGPVVQYYMMPVIAQGALAVQEPWHAVVVAGIAFFILRHRLRAQAIERRMALIDAEKKTVDHVAKISLAMRDLTMTPLQSIALTSSLLEADKLDRRAAAEHLDRALDRLRELSRVLNKHEHDVDWRTTTASFDAVSDLERQLGPGRHPEP